MSARVTVVGIGEDGWDGLGARARAAVADAPLVVGAARHLGLLPVTVGVVTKPLPAPLRPGLFALIDDNPGLCVLASGDPMWHGIGATLTRELGPDAVTVLPAASSASLACARLGWPLHDVTTASLLTGEPEDVLAALHDGARILVLARDASSPAAVARVLAAQGWGASRLTVLANLGGAREEVVGPILAADMSGAAGTDLVLVAIEAMRSAHVRARTRVPGLPDEVFATDGALTRREVRVLVLALLAPAPGELLWDVGAGSGSVAIEWMRGNPRNRAVAVEARDERVARITANARALGTPALTVVAGAAPDALDGLDRPDAVFIGGGLTTPGVVGRCWSVLPAGGRLVATAVTVEGEMLLVERQRRLGGELVRIAASRLGPLGGFTTWRPELPITVWGVTKA